MALPAAQRAGVLDDVMLALLSCGLPNNVAFKGGYILDKALDTRSTVDIDMSAGDRSAFVCTRDAMLRCGEVLKQRGSVAGCAFKEIRPLESGRLELYDFNGVKITCIDIQVQRIDRGVQIIKLELNPLGMGVKLVNVPVYSYEKMLGDKIDANFSRQQFRRTKDLYDIYKIITSVCIDGESLHREIMNRGIDIISSQYSPFSADALPKWIHAWDRLIIQDRNGLQRNLPLLQEVLGMYLRFIEEYLIIRNKPHKGLWNPDEGRFI